MNTASWLVDVGYVVRASENKFRLDYVAAEQFVVERCGPARSFLFNGFDEAYGIPRGLRAFYEAMKRVGMEVSLQPMESGAPGNNRQRRVDVDFSAHVVWQASLPHVESLILTTGDQDFVPAVDLVRERFSKRVILFTYEANVHADLIAAADERWLFEEHEAMLAR
jgi:uncharacterized LabA/DUF88 family protein